MSRPGVMLYFNIRPAMRFLNNEQNGRLFIAILDYAEHGTVPDFGDMMLDMAWSFISSGIDKDGEAYLEKIDKRKYAAFCREAQKKLIKEISFEEWRGLTEDERKRLLTADERKRLHEDNELKRLQTMKKSALSYNDII